MRPPSGGTMRLMARQSPSVRCKSLNNVVEQGHRAVKRITRPMLGFKSFEAAQSTLAGIELIHMIRNSQLASGTEQALTH